MATRAFGQMLAQLECSAPQERAGIFIASSYLSKSSWLSAGHHLKRAWSRARLFHSISNASGRLGVVNVFPGIEQVFPGYRKSRQSNVGRGWFTKKSVSGKKRFGNALIIGPLRSHTLHQPILGHVNSDIQAEVDSSNNEISSPQNLSCGHYSSRWKVPHRPDAVQVPVGHQHWGGRRTPMRVCSWQWRGSLYQIEACQEFWLKCSETLRKLDLAVETARWDAEEQMPKKLAEAISLNISEWLRRRALMGIRDIGEWKSYAIERFKGILDLTVKSSPQTRSPIPAWAAEKVKEAWNIH